MHLITELDDYLLKIGLHSQVQAWHGNLCDISLTGGAGLRRSVTC